MNIGQRASYCLVPLTLAVLLLASCFGSTQDVLVKGVSLVPETLELVVGSSSQLAATVSPSKAKNKTLSWESSDESVATVLGGLVTGIQAGTATITVTTNDGGFTDTCVVTVTAAVVNVNSVSIPATLELYPGASSVLPLEITPSNATNQGLEWSSSNIGVATVDGSGLVTGVSPGSSTITVTTDDGNLSAECQVTVHPVAVTGVSLPLTAGVVVGTTTTLIATIEPSNASNKGLSWYTSASSVATISSTGIVFGVSPGSAVIQVTTDDGDFTRSCALTVTYTSVAVTSVAIPAQLSLYHGQSSVLNATITPANATNQTLSWSSSDEGIATVSSSGLVTGISPGSAKITVTTNDGNISAECQVTVNPVAVTGVSLPLAAGVVLGGSTTLTATIAPTNASNKALTWQSLAPLTATVDDLGKVSGVAPGTAVITARSVDGGKTAACTVTVTAHAISVTGVSLLPQTLTLADGQSAVLGATVSPANATNQSLTWTTSNAAVATVDKGTVTGINPGTALVTVRTADGGYTAVCEVTVTATAATGVTVSPSTLSIWTGAIASLEVAILPASATNQGFTCTSSDPSRVEVYSIFSGGVWVRGLAAGEATVTVVSNDGSWQDTCTITVNDQPPAPVPATGVAVLPAAVYLVAEGSSWMLTAVVSPANATDKRVSWASSNTSVATVSGGTVTPVGAGTSTITATTVDGSFTATSQVTVTTAPVPVTSVAIPGTLVMAVGGTASLVASILPANATDKSLNWTSSAPAIATVSNGLVTGVRSGTATITAASASNGSVLDTCTVTVTASGTVIILGE